MWSPRGTTPTPVVVTMTWDAIGTGWDSGYGIRSGELWAWGRNDVGQLGLDASMTGEMTSRRVGTISDWVVVDGGADFACAIRADGALYCTGANVSGELGLGDTDMREEFTPVCFPTP